MNRDPSRPGLLRRGRRWLVILAILMAGVAVCGFVAYQLRAPILTWAGGWLYHADPLVPADAIVALAGGSLDREVEAADLYAAGYAPTVVLTRTPERPVVAELQARGLDVSTELESRLDYLAMLGVAREAVTVLQPLVQSTQDEAELLAEWAESRELERLIVVTSGYHTSRTRFIFDRVFAGGTAEVLIQPSTVSGFSPDTWWHRRGDLREGLVELQKYAYYRLMYLARQQP
jgi:uncharacterized SAM-binding protein YcdF (DUF218 family)